MKTGRITGRAVPGKGTTGRAGPNNSCFAKSNVDDIYVYVNSIQMCWLISKTVKSLLNLLVLVPTVASSMKVLSDFQISCAISELILSLIL